MRLVIKAKNVWWEGQHQVAMQRQLPPFLVVGLLRSFINM